MISFVNMNTIPAEIKKKENIAEYIIHMYQTEDLIHAYQFNLDEINAYVIKHMSKDEQVRKEILLWYAGIIEQMQAEGINKPGKHLIATQKYVEALTTLHEKLLVENDFYQATYIKAKKDIANHIALSDGTINNPIQICLNGIYGMLLIRLNGKKISAEQQKTLANFGEVLGTLSRFYKKSEIIS